MIMKQLARFISAALLMVLLASPALAEEVAAAAPATQPAGNYRLTLQSVFGAPASQYVFLLSLPGGGHGITSSAKLMDYIQLTVPAGATLEWAPDCCVMGDEPLRTQEELDALTKFCKEHKINLVLIRAG